MRYLKKDASAETVESICRIETIADDCYKSLRLLQLPNNISIWGLLAGGIKIIEQEIAVRGDNTFHLTAALLNVSRFLPIGLKWMHKWGHPPSKLVARQWSTPLSALVDETISVANGYSAFLTSFPMWHRQRYEAELISSTVVRFSSGTSERAHQVSAFQKGIRPKEGFYKEKRPEKPQQTARVQQLFQRVFDLAKGDGTLGFSYHDPWELWRELEIEYSARVDAIVRRGDSVSLGAYNLGEFKRFYSAFLALCATHEFLCFIWAKNHSVYPFDSAVLVRARSNWISTLAWLSGVSLEKCQHIVQDLTFDFTRSLDLHIHPFVALDSGSNTLAVAPQFPLHSRPDENILRVCSVLRPKDFDVASLSKESELLANLQTSCASFSPQGPISLPSPIPDIDLLLADEASSTVVVAELKWIRKTVRPVEMEDRDAEVLKGTSQLREIRNFLQEHPRHLKTLGKLPGPLDKYQNVVYLLIARDHWLWVEPVDNIAIVEFDAVQQTESLYYAVKELLSYEWLPIAARDFTVRYERATVNGVSLESEIFYSVAE
jgi:hypothetical protein